YEKIYLTLDIDGVDPAFAPGTGTPEPYGLEPMQVKKIIDALAPKLVGFDIVEVAPPLESRITPVLAARFVTNVVASTYVSKKQRR
ncbi:MAG: arginase family protein, partial [Thermoplasmata archaeon]